MSSPVGKIQVQVTTAELALEEGNFLDAKKHYEIACKLCDHAQKYSRDALAKELLQLMRNTYESRVKSIDDYIYNKDMSIMVDTNDLYEEVIEDELTEVEENYYYEPEEEDTPEIEMIQQSSSPLSLNNLYYGVNKLVSYINSTPPNSPPPPKTEEDLWGSFCIVEQDSASPHRSVNFKVQNQDKRRLEQVITHSKKQQRLIEALRKQNQLLLKNFSSNGMRSILQENTKLRRSLLKTKQPDNFSGRSMSTIRSGTSPFRRTVSRGTSAISDVNMLNTHKNRFSIADNDTNMITLQKDSDDKIERLEQALNEKDNNIEELNAKIEQLKNLLDVRKMSESPTEIYEPVPSGNTSYQVQSLQDEKSVLEHQLSDLQAYVKDRELQINHYVCNKLEYFFFISKHFSNL
mmetsp:Transcript_7835/g.8634  ORF Transcript_7835/g.8634 Transcript_7835/m.8634 type:complete len:405 (+) Transcript_7835:136-1350(+)